jgi:hypothetical protein
VSRRLLAFGIALLAPAALLPAAGEAGAAKAKPARAALAVGASSGGGASFRLEGTTLVVRAPDGLGGTVHQARVRLIARCGESVVAPAATSAATLAVQGGRRISSTTRRTVLRVVLSRDVAARANWCELREVGGRAVLRTATMRLRRGRAPGCVPAGREKVAFREGATLVTMLSAEIETDGDLDRFYRVCMRARNALEPLTAITGSAYDSGEVAGMAGGGRWLAWASSSRTRDDHSSVTIDLVDVRSDGPVKSVYVGGFSGMTVHVPHISELLIDDDGVVVWALVHRYDDPRRPEWATLDAGSVGGRARQLDRIEPASGLTDVAFGADGSTVTWRNDGVERSAALR